MTEPVVFAGPCLAGLGERRRRTLLAGFDLQPPAQRGDVLAAVARRPVAIVLLDGYYYTVGAVTHKELLYALEEGVRVIGAASMGALRAAEMEAFGMTGVGRIFSWYRDGVLDGDDEVAVLHAPAERGYRPVTLALVEIRAALACCVDRAEMELGAADRLIAAVKDLPFTERSAAAVFGLAADLLGPAGRDLLRARLAAHSVKQQDAEDALELARRAPALERPRPTSRPGRTVDYTSFDLERSLAARADPQLAHRKPTLVEVWATAQLLHPQAADFAADLRARYLLAAAALDSGLDSDPQSEDEIAEQLESRLRALGGAALLPRREARDEARSLALSEAAERRWGGRDVALQAFADRLGQPLGSELPRLVETMSGGAGYLPAWWMARAFVFHPAFPAALRTAAAACEVRRRFEIWADGAVLRRQQLRSLAASLWGCCVEEVEAEGTRRGMLDLGGRSLGLYEALALLAPAELLRRPLNDYPYCREELRSVGQSPRLHAVST